MQFFFSIKNKLFRERSVRRQVECDTFYKRIDTSNLVVNAGHSIFWIKKKYSLRILAIENGGYIFHIYISGYLCLSLYKAKLRQTCTKRMRIALKCRIFSVTLLIKHAVIIYQNYNNSCVRKINGLIIVSI